MKLLFFGDTLIDRDIEFSDEFFRICNSYDFCVVNLEGIFVGNGTPINKAGPHICSNETYIDSFADKFKIVTLANNHTMDFGESSLNHTMSILSDNNIQWCGAGSNRKEAHKPLFLGDVSIISVAENEFGSSDINKAGIACYEDLRILYNNIQECKKRGKVVICYHGGSEIIPVPPRYLRDRFKLLSDFGVDLIIGNHPHVVQGFEENIFYSLGNFVFLGSGGNFSPYKNSDWSLVVGYDTETSAITKYCVRMADNKIILDEDKFTELEFLSSIISSDEYETISDKVSCLLHQLWYPDYFRSGHQPITLHYLRCDAHRNNISVGLSRMVGEFDDNLLEKYIIEVNGESITVKENGKCN